MRPSLRNIPLFNPLARTTYEAANLIIPLLITALLIPQIAVARVDECGLVAA
jgi:hypothetical protein